MKGKRLFGAAAIAAALAAAAAASCGRSPHPSSAGGCCRIAPLDCPLVRDTADLGRLADTTFLVPLADDEALLSAVRKLLVTSDGRYVVHDRTGVFLFAPDGRFLRRVGMQGRGPGEYAELADVALDPSDTTLVLLDAAGKVLRYDLSTGRCLKRVALDWCGAPRRVDAIAPGPGGGFWIFSAQVEPSLPDEAVPTLFSFDADGRLREGLLPTREFVLPLFCITQTAGGYFLRPVDAGNAVCRLGPELGVAFVVDFGRRAAPEGATYGDGGMQDMTGYLSSAFCKMPSCIHATDRWLSLLYVGPGTTLRRVVCDSASGAGFALEAPDGRTFQQTFMASDHTTFYGVLPVISDEEAERQADPLLKLLLGRHGRFAGDGNPAIVGFRFRSVE